MISEMQGNRMVAEGKRREREREKREKREGKERGWCV